MIKLVYLIYFMAQTKKKGVVSLLPESEWNPYVHTRARAQSSSSDEKSKNKTVGCHEPSIFPTSQNDLKQLQTD